MNYRHIFHAGNFADVVKHITLIGLCQALSQKEKPWCFLDIHAGKGLYRLSSEEAQKTQEYKNGVERLVNAMSPGSTINLENALASSSLINSEIAPNDMIHSRIVPNVILQTYLSILQKFQYPEFYPGSPLIVQQCIRENDRMILIEKHPEEFAELKSELDFRKKNQNIALHHQDGYLALKAFLPPKEKRGLILLDPPYETLDEWENILEGLKTALKRFANGVFALWYPIKNKKAVEEFKASIKEAFKGPLKETSNQSLKELHSEKILFAEIGIYPEDSPQGLNACGMAIINPPWQFKEILESLYPFLWEVLSYERTGYYSVE